MELNWMDAQHTPPGGALLLLIEDDALKGCADMVTGFYAEGEYHIGTTTAGDSLKEGQVVRYWAVPTWPVGYDDSGIRRNYGVTREFLLRGIDHKMPEAVQQMELAVSIILAEFDMIAARFKDMRDGAVRFDANSLNEILAARARGRFCARLLNEVESHYFNTGLHELLRGAIQRSIVSMSHIEENARALLKFYE
ncbi:MAG: hypothetical protein Q4G70_14510 [Pseudomonadota bacterium]|nr:hypothetical protein [Pseudomonadota bacterium]